MVKIYGREDCIDCAAFKKACDENEIDYDFRDIGKSLREMAVFLKIRDTNEAFEKLKGTGQIGIPAIVLEDRTVILNWKNYLKMKKHLLTIALVGASLFHQAQPV